MFLFLLAPAIIHSQSWSGIIAPARATDWTQAGLPGDVPPDGSWTQCGSTVAPYGTSSSYGTSATIQAAISACGFDQYVLFGAGDFYIDLRATYNTGIYLKSNMEVRGAGPNLTRFHFKNAGSTCNGQGAGFCIAGGNTYANGAGGANPGCGGCNTANWTSGYSQGTTTITLDNVSGITPNLTPIYLDQCNTGFTGSSSTYACTGTAADNGAAFICETAGTCSVQGGTNNYRAHRSQFQAVLATSISGSGPYTVTIKPPIQLPNWSASETPQAWWSNGGTITNAGVENLLVDSSLNGGNESITVQTCYRCWVIDVASSTASGSHVLVNTSIYVLSRDNYFWNTLNHADQSYGYSAVLDGEYLIENSIAQAIVDPIAYNGPCSGCVNADNFAVNMYYGQSNQALGSTTFHSAGNADILTERPIGNYLASDVIHGTHDFNTFLRPYWNGYESNNGTMPTANVTAVYLAAYSRYYNLVGGVYGTAGYFTNPPNSLAAYQCAISSATQGSNPSYWDVPSTAWCLDISMGQSYHEVDLGWSAIVIGQTDYNNTPPTPNDPLVSSTLLSWGNYDAYQNAVSWNGFQVPTTDPNYPNPIPANHTIPSSFYNGVTTAFPSCGTGIPYWKNPTTGTCPPYPNIGPDVTNGDIGLCTAGPYKWSRALNLAQCGSGGAFTPADDGGHAYSSPAMRCYLNQMGGPPDGTGPMLTFNPSACYALDSGGGGVNQNGNCNETQTTTANVAAQAQHQASIIENQNTADALTGQRPGTSSVCVQRH